MLLPKMDIILSTETLSPSCIGCDGHPVTTEASPPLDGAAIKRPSVLFVSYSFKFESPNQM